MPRIPLSSLEQAIVLNREDPTDMVILPGPVYILTVDGETNIVFGVDLYKTHNCSYLELQSYLRKQTIPPVWR